MKATVQEHEEQAQQFPMLVCCTHSGRVYLAVSCLKQHYQGTLVYSPNDTDRLGGERSLLSMSCTKPFHGTVTLEN